MSDNPDRLVWITQLKVGNEKLSVPIRKTPEGYSINFGDVFKIVGLELGDKVEVTPRLEQAIYSAFFAIEENRPFGRKAEWNKLMDLAA